MQRAWAMRSQCLTLANTCSIGVEVGRVGRQGREPGAGCEDCTACRPSPMAAEVVENDDVSRAEHRQQELLDVGAEDHPVDGAVDDARGGERIGSEGGKKGERAPAAVGREALQPLSLDAPAAHRGHVGLDPGLIDEDEALRVEMADRASPARAPPGDVGAMLLTGECGFF